MGALVKSHEVGLSVPDWPTTYGKNMFAFPLSDMVGGIFYEHGHRLVATVVGFFTMVQAMWLGISGAPDWLKKVWIYISSTGPCSGSLWRYNRFILSSQVCVYHTWYSGSNFFHDNDLDCIWFIHRTV